MPKKKATQPVNYQSAMEELQSIVEQVEGEELDVDQLSEKVKQALQLINYCKQKLKNTEETLGQAFEEN